MVWQHLIDRLLPTARRHPQRSVTRRRLRMQTLVKRELLASDLAAISGIAFVDADGSGTQNGAEVALAGVQVQLFRDANDDGVRDGGDNLIGTAQVTGADGRYRFANLDGDDDDGDPLIDLDKTDSGQYILVFSDAPGGPDLSGLSLPDDTVVIVTADTGITARTIDDYTTQQPGQPVTVGPVGSLASSSDGAGTLAGVIGGERDVLVTVDANTGVSDATLQIDSVNNQLDFSAGNNVTGRVLVQYDGTDADGGGAALTLNPVGLQVGGNGIPLNSRPTDDPATPGFDESNVQDSAAGLLLEISSDQAAVGALELRIFTDANNWSFATVDLPGGNVLTEVFLPFDLVTFALGGTATGPADFADVGAIEFELVAGQVPVGLDFGASIVESQRSNENAVNAPVIQPLTIGGEIFLDNGNGTNAADRNNGVRDAGEAEVPASPGNEIIVQLFALTDLNDTVQPGDTPVATTTVTGGGTTGAYFFDQLTNGDPITPGTYAVVIPSSEFGAGQPLFGHIASIRQAGYTNADGNVNTDNDGALVPGVGVVSGAITLAINGEPDTPIDGTDTNDNRTVDFGVVPTMDLRITKNLLTGTGNSDLTPGGTAVFEIIVNNFGPLGATNVQVQDFIPDGLTFTSVQTSPGGVAVPTTTSVEPVAPGRQIRTFQVGALASGASQTFRVTTAIDGNVTSDPLNEARVSGFEVEVDSDPTNSDGVGTGLDDDPELNNVSTANVDIPLASLTVAKTDGLTTINAGDAATYTITVNNTSTDPANNVLVTDTLPAGVTFVSATSGGVAVTPTSTTGGVIVFPTFPLTGTGTPATATRTLTVNVTVDPAFLPIPGSITNSVTAQADNAPLVTATDVNTVARLTDVRVAKTVVQTRVPDIRDTDPTGDTITSTAPFQFVAGGFATYRIQAINDGPSQARGVTITDTLPAGLTLVPGSFAAGSSGVTLAQAGQTLTFTVPDLAPDDPAVTTDDVFFTFEVGIASNSPAGTVIPNTATIATTDPESSSTNNTATANLTPTARLDLTVLKSVNTPTAVPGTVASGGTALTYTVVVSHDTDSLSDAAGVNVTDTLPAGLTNVVISAPGSVAGGTFNATTRQVQVQYASIPVGETRTFTITANVLPDATAAQVNTAVVAVPGTTELDTTNNTSSVTVTLTPQFDLTVDKSIQGATTTFGPNDTVVFNLLVAHDTADDGTEADNGQSPSRATGVVVTDTLPAGLTFVSATSGGVAVTPTSTTGGVIVFPAFTLDPGVTRMLTLTATVNPTATGTLTNNVALVTATGETETTNNSDSEAITVTPRANVRVSKTVNPTTAVTGTQLTYTVTVNNDGPSPADAVTAIDTLPAGVTFVSGTGPNGALTATNGVVTVNGGTLASGGSFQFTILATLNTGTTADQINTVTVSTTTTETNTTDNTATATTVVDQAINQIAGRVFNDANRNGIQDTGELGAEGVQLRLTGGNIPVDRTVTTDSLGDYVFSQLGAGTYTVERLSLPAETADGLEQAGTGATPAESGDDIESITVGNGTTARPQNNFAVVPIISKRRFLRSFYD